MAPRSNAPTTAPTGDRKKFKELAEKRTTKALSAIGNIGTLANPKAYLYTAADVKAITDALLSQITGLNKRMTDALQGKHPTQAAGFNLS